MESGTPCRPWKPHPSPGDDGHESGRTAGFVNCIQKGAGEHCGPQRRSGHLPLEAATCCPSALKIVFLSPAAQRGGAEAVLLELLGVLREARPAWSLHVLAGEDGPLLATVRAMNVSCETLPFPPAVRSFGENRQAPASGQTVAPWRRMVAKAARLAGWLGAAGGVLRYGWKLRRRLRRLRPDLLHSNGMKMHLLGAVAKPGRTPLIWHLHDYLGSRPAMKPLLRRLSSRCALVVANSQSVARDVRAALPGGPAVAAVYNAVNLDAFRPAGPALDLDRLAGLPPAPAGTVRIGLVATFAFWKGHEVFLRAATATLGASRFYVVGGPVYATAGSQRSVEELRAVAGSLGLLDRTGFTGFVEDVPAAMRALDIVVHASTEPEPFGLVIVQAMACGRAVIISEAGGAAELVEPEISALVHRPRDVGGLTLAMDRLIASAELRARLGEAGRRRVAERFTMRQMAGQIVPLFGRLSANE